jgi:serine/threonine-protein kinase HipA
MAGKGLSLWVNGVHVGRWIVKRGGEHELRYAESWVEHPRGRPLSLSLPLNFDGQPLKGQSVANYFDNLLPDTDAIRRRVAQRFATRSESPFDLLTAIGRDCIGALQILGPDEEPEGLDQIEGVPQSDKDIERHLVESVGGQGMGFGTDPDEDFRISLAGAQEKTAFLRSGGQWLVPRGSTPTTHIFKLPLGLVGNRRVDLGTSVDNEWLCLRLMKAYGLPTANAEIATFGQHRVLVVERFDRMQSKSDAPIVRLMQEDFCQALGYSPLHKYESHGGPGLEQLFGTLKASSNAAGDMRTLMATQILFWMLRATDGHAKNFSIFLQPRGHFRLTPVYDVISMLPYVGRGADQLPSRKLKLAMALLGKSKHYDVHNVQRRHFNSTAEKVGYRESVDVLIDEIIERTPGAITEVRAALPPDFDPAVAEAILTGLQNSADELEAMS